MENKMQIATVKIRFKKIRSHNECKMMENKSKIKKIKMKVEQRMRNLRRDIKPEKHWMESLTAASFGSAEVHSCVSST